LPSTLALNNIGSGRWADGITVHYAAIHCQQGTTGPAVPLLVVVVYSSRRRRRRNVSVWTQVEDLGVYTSITAFNIRNIN